MSVSRDDFGIAFRSALLQRGASQKFSIFSLIIVAIIIFFLDVYGFQAVKTTRSSINDLVYRVTYLASTPTRLFPGINNPLANQTDFSCIAQILGCTNSIALNYNSYANFDDQSCVFSIPGCINSLAMNFNPNANTPTPGSCIYYGCTDPSALNYDSAANLDDGSCIYNVADFGCVLPDNYSGVITGST